MPAGRDSRVSFDVDVTELHDRTEHSRRRMCRLAGSMKLISPADPVIAHIVALRAEEAAAAEVARRAAEPEVVKKGKKEEEAAPREKGKKKKK